MKIKVTKFLGAFVVALMCAAASFAQDGQITGGYGETDVNDEGVVKAARFAVSKRGRNTGAKVTLIKTENAKVQVVSGLNYEVCLYVSVKRPGRKAYRQYAKVVVYRNLRNVHSLTSWTILKNKSGC